MRDLKYTLAAAGTLGTFQLLEFSLKIYISGTYNVIKIILRNQVPFDYSFNDIKNYPLERLINIFSKLSCNNVLIAKLNKLRDDRNHLAHQALIYQVPGIEQLLGIDLDAESEGFANVESEVRDCLALLFEDLKGLMHTYERVAP